MDISNIKESVENLEGILSTQPFVVLCTFERDARPLHLALTERLRKLARKERIWKSRSFYQTLKNAEYGFDEQLALSRGGRDGIFLLDANHRRKNEMMKKVFDQYLLKQRSGAQEVAKQLGTSVDMLQAVRLVSHHLRLLGVLWRTKDADWLVLVDLDRS